MTIWRDFRPGAVPALATLTTEVLGLDINEAQTGLTCSELVGQDPGQRILCPDLMTFNPIEVAQ